MTEVFVFGSNLAGRHGAGSALEARKSWGAIYGQGVGRQGNSYAIPTKDVYLHTLELPLIGHYVHEFLAYAKEHRKDIFRVVAIGCGLAGYRAEQIGPFFAEAGSNVILPKEFEPYRRTYLSLRTRSYQELAPEAGSVPSTRDDNPGSTESGRQSQRSDK